MASNECEDPGRPQLVRDAERGLLLVSGAQELRCDFDAMAHRLQPRNLARELLVRAARVRGVEHPVALDATAGLGEDSLLLAAAGFDVVMYERDHVIASLLQDGLRRAALPGARPEVVRAVARTRLVEADSVEALHRMADGMGEEPGPRPDVVLLDPMFPERRKSAAVRKKLQLIQQLERPCDDEAALLDAALAVRPRKVVVKRPAKGPCLAGQKPSYSLSGKAVRYDVLVP